MEKPNRPKKDFGEEIYDLMKKHNVPMVDPNEMMGTDEKFV